MCLFWYKGRRNRIPFAEDCIFGWTRIEKFKRIETSRQHWNDWHFRRIKIWNILCKFGQYLKLIFANKYESDHITFKYWFRTYTQTEYPTNPKTYTAEITTLKTQKLKPRIPRFDFLQIILESNNDSDQFEDGVGNTVSTTLNDKIGFVSIALNYLLLEG